MLLYYADINETVLYYQLAPSFIGRARIKSVRPQLVIYILKHCYPQA